MNCCGQKRQQWQQQKIQQADTIVLAEPVLENPVSLRYSGLSSCVIKGAKTGYLYLFAGNEESLMVDSRDAVYLLEEPEKFSPG